MTPTGRSREAYDAGIRAFKDGKTAEGNPYLRVSIKNGGPAFSGWWSAGFVKAKQESTK